jgi:hypothetical protein
METITLDGGEGQTYGGEEVLHKDQVTHAAWTQDFFPGGPPTKERKSKVLLSDSR